MSIKCQSWVYQFSEARGNDRLVLLAIADEADDDGTNAYPGIKKIAHKARVNERTTMRCIERLEEEGRLIVERPATKGRGHYNTYIVVMEEPNASRQKGDTVTPFPGDGENDGSGTETTTEDRVRPRKTAPQVVNRGRPIDPLTHEQPTTPPPPPETSTALVLVPSPLPAQAPVKAGIRVFDTWIEATGRTGATALSEKRKRLIRAALKMYPLEDVLDAVCGWRKSPYHCGENDRGIVYNDIGLLLRDAEHIEFFRDLERKPYPVAKATRAPVAEAADAYLRSRREM